MEDRMNFTDIIYEKSDRVATVTLNRPERMNAWRGQLESEMRSAMQDADADPAIGAIVVTGAGKAFCAGMDMAGLGNSPLPMKVQLRSSRESARNQRLKCELPWPFCLDGRDGHADYRRDQWRPRRPRLCQQPPLRYSHRL